MSDTQGPLHVRMDDQPWSDYARWYPDEMMQTMRAKRLIGPGGAIHSDSTLFGLLEIDPGASYPPHRHPAAEIYYVLSGEAECTFWDEVFVAGPGSVIRTLPNMVHGFRVLGDAPFRAVAYWYDAKAAPEVLRGDLELLPDG